MTTIKPGRFDRLNIKVKGIMRDTAATNDYYISDLNAILPDNSAIGIVLLLKEKVSEYLDMLTKTTPPIGTWACLINIKNSFYISFSIDYLG